MMFIFFFFNDTATTEIYTLSLHDALPILSSPTGRPLGGRPRSDGSREADAPRHDLACRNIPGVSRCRAELAGPRSEEHTSELQSRQYLVCRLLLEKKKKKLCKKY